MSPERTPIPTPQNVGRSRPPPLSSAATESTDRSRSSDSTSLRLSPLRMNRIEKWVVLRLFLSLNVVVKKGKELNEDFASIAATMKMK